MRDPHCISALEGRRLVAPGDRREPGAADCSSSRAPQGRRSRRAIPLLRPSGARIRRSGFTLVEMIVVIGIMVVLMALAVAVVPRVQERSKAARGADQLQGWLLISKQIALRDRFPRGIRLNAVVDTDANIVHAHQLQYIEQPPDLSSQTFGAIQLPLTPAAPPLIVPFVRTNPPVDLSYGLPNDPSSWAVQPGDFLVVNNGTMHKILVVQPTQIQVLYNPLNPLLPPTATAPIITTEYTIIRQPRPIAGESELLLPKDIIIDLSLSYPSVPLPAAGTTPAPVDIMFSPSGGVVGDQAQNGKIILWVRDESQDNVPSGGDTLITIYTRTGLIAAHPVDVSSPPGSYYNFTQDGRSSGM